MPKDFATFHSVVVHSFIIANFVPKITHSKVMKQKVFITVFVLLWEINMQAQDERVKVGDSAPAFTVEMFDGTIINISELKGKVVLLNFWATWCPPCRMEFARVQKDVINRFKCRDFVFLPISREDSYEKIHNFRQSTGHSFPMGMDPTRAIFSKFADQSIPRNYLIDKKGKIVKIEIGYTPENFDKLITEIEKLLE
ncbi:MAG: TlpA family protein disulfide reductase [Cytophagaceae bacterium]|jgi:peroxiredoxin|nr:TlpA family protein disulfide reductase [Cytophagaceae bacterium]